MPLRLFRSKTLNAANAIGILWSAAMFAWFFLSALYLQRVLGATADAGRPRLPAVEHHHGSVLARPVGARRHALRPALAARLRPASAPRSAWRCSRARRSTAASLLDVLPGMLLLGLGAGIAFNPLLLAAMSRRRRERVGPRLGHRQHLVHDGRRARARRAREPGGAATPGRRARAAPARSPRSTTAIALHSASARCARWSPPGSARCCCRSQSARPATPTDSRAERADQAA